MLAAPEPALGPRLRSLRESRRLARPEAAARSGASPQALKDWESGRRTPRGPALVRLLDELAAPPRLRAELIALADPRHARIALSAYPAGPPVDRGAMLRALRLRAGLTQDEVAARAGVAQSAVAHWEAGDRVLEGESLGRALRAAEARPEEASAVLASPHAPSAFGDDPDEADEAIDRLPGPLRELALLAHERALWWRAAREPAAEEALRHTVLHRAIHYAFLRRLDEAAALARRLDAMARDPASRRLAAKARIVLGDVRFRPEASPRDLLRRLTACEADLPPSIERAWLRGTGAVALASAGESSALSLAREAMDEAARFGHKPVEAWLRRVDLAEVCLRLGDPEGALETLGEDHRLWNRPGSAVARATAGLSTRAHALMALGREPEPELLAVLRGHAAVERTAFAEARLAGVERALARLRSRACRRDV